MGMIPSSPLWSIDPYHRSLNGQSTYSHVRYHPWQIRPYDGVINPSCSLKNLVNHMNHFLTLFLMGVAYMEVGWLAIISLHLFLNRSSTRLFLTPPPDVFNGLPEVAAGGDWKGRGVRNGNLSKKTASLPMKYHLFNRDLDDNGLWNNPHITG